MELKIKLLNIINYFITNLEIKYLMHKKIVDCYLSIKKTFWHSKERPERMQRHDDVIWQSHIRSARSIDTVWRTCGIYIENY